MHRNQSPQPIRRRLASAALWAGLSCRGGGGRRVGAKVASLVGQPARRAATRLASEANGGPRVVYSCRQARTRVEKLAILGGGRGGRVLSLSGWAWGQRHRAGRAPKAEGAPGLIRDLQAGRLRAFCLGLGGWALGQRARPQSQPCPPSFPKPGGSRRSRRALGALLPTLLRGAGAQLPPAPKRPRLSPQPWPLPYGNETPFAHAPANARRSDGDPRLAFDAALRVAFDASNQQKVSGADRACTRITRAACVPRAPGRTRGLPPSCRQHHQLIPATRVHRFCCAWSSKRTKTVRSSALACAVIRRICIRGRYSRRAAFGPQAPPGASSLGSLWGRGSARPCASSGLLWRPSTQSWSWRCGPWGRIRARFFGCDGRLADLPCTLRCRAAARCELG